MKQYFKKEWFLVLVLILLSGFLFMFKLGDASLFETDEYIYTQIAKEIISGGDWLTLHLLGQPWFIHPPLYMWITAATGFLFGFSEFTARLWCALFGIFGVLLTYYFGKMFFSRRAGFLSAIVLATSLQYILQARLAVFDIPLMFFTVLPAYLFFVGHKNKWDPAYLLAALSMGLGTVMKGPISLLLPGMIIFLFLLLKGELLKFLRDRWAWVIAGAFIYFATALPWFIAEYMLHGSIFLERVIGFYTINRFLGVVETHRGPFWFYIPVLILGFLPWVVFFVPAIIDLFKHRQKDQNLFILLWIAVTFVFFSVARTKLPGYIISLYPFMSLMVGNYLAKRLEFSVWVRRFFYFSLIFVIIFYIGLIYFLTPLVEAQKPMQPLASLANQMILPEDTVIGYKILYKLGFDYYLEPAIIWVEEPEALKTLVRSRRNFIFLPKNEIIVLQNLFGQHKIAVLKEQANRVLIVIEKN